MPIERIDPELCNGCAICYDICPMDVIYMNEETGKAYPRYPKDCVACSYCERDCPENAISVSPQFGRPISKAW